VLRNGGDTKEEMMEDDIELQRLFRSVIKEMSDSGNIVFRANLEGPWKGKL